MRSLKLKTLCLFILVVYAAAASEVSAQAVPRREGPPSAKIADATPAMGMVPGTGDTFERSIAVDPKVNVSLCVTEGNVRINGWTRNELRVFVKDGGKFGFKILQKSPSTGSPVWLMLIGMESVKGKAAPTVSECIWGNEIEIDLPENAVVDLKCRVARTRVDNVRKVSATTDGGDITVRNVAQGVTAATYRGDIMVENSNGPISLGSASGNIVAFGLNPAEIGDSFRAKTSGGTISLQRLGFRQIEVKSISGSIIYAGEILSGGSYTFGTTNGSIRLSIPQTTSSMIVAVYGYGSFNCELPMKLLTEDTGPGPLKRISGRLGTGDASVSLTTDTGSILIKKQ